MLVLPMLLGGLAMSDCVENVTQALERLRLGEMIIVVDSVHRENEGDLVIAADCIDKEKINFMSKFGRGLICLTLTGERCQLLGLNPVPQAGSGKNHTNFVDSIDAAEGISTGISAADRARTIQVATDPRSAAADLRRPGHIFPLQAADGGVLVRAGHTEAGCDLARLAGYTPAAVIVEILNEDGSMARRGDLLEFSQRHELFMLDIDDLIQYRLRTERIVHRVGSRTLTARAGQLEIHLYRDLVHHHHHLAIVVGAPDMEKTTLVRVHRSKYLNDLLSLDSLGGLRSWDFHSSMDYLFRHGGGVMLLINESRSVEHESLDSLLCSQFDRLSTAVGADPMPSAADAPDKTEPPSWSGSSERETGIGSQILKELNLRDIAILGRSQRVFYHGLSAFGLNIKSIIEYPRSETD